VPKVMIATPFRHITRGNSELEIGGATAGETLGKRAEEYPELKQYLYTSDGKLHPSIDVLKDEEDIRHLDGPDTEISDGDKLAIIPSTAGGCAEG
jgi:sulfur-carrier protein